MNKKLVRNIIIGGVVLTAGFLAYKHFTKEEDVNGEETHSGASGCGCS